MDEYPVYDRGLESVCNMLIDEPIISETEKPKVDKMPFKIKIGGIKTTVRRMDADEVIDEHTLCRWNGIWVVSLAQGDKVGEHYSREYVRMLSRGIEKFPEIIKEN